MAVVDVLGSSLLSSSSSMLAVMSTTHDVSGLHWCFLKASSNIGLLLMLLDIALNSVTRAAGLCYSYGKR